MPGFSETFNMPLPAKGKAVFPGKKS